MPEDFDEQEDEEGSPSSVIPNEEDYPKIQPVIATPLLAIIGTPPLLRTLSV